MLSVICTYSFTSRRFAGVYHHAGAAGSDDSHRLHSDHHRRQRRLLCQQHKRRREQHGAACLTAALLCARALSASKALKTHEPFRVQGRAAASLVCRAVSRLQKLSRRAFTGLSSSSQTRRRAARRSRWT